MVRLAMCVGLVVGFCEVAVVRADTGAQQPWTVGVSAEQKAAARTLLDAGNELFLARKYVEALDKYREAVKTWDHPAIRFNIVRCLVLLDKPLEAYADLEKALAYGAAPFDESIYSEALGYQKLLAKQVGELEVACKQEGVALTLDGQPLPACPGAHARRVLPGQHQVVATKQGFVPRTLEIVMLGGDRKHADVEVVPVTTLTRNARIEHRWSQWFPWSVVGGGIALAGAAGLLHLAATSNQDAYRDFVVETCPTGCNTNELDHSLESRASLQNNLAIGVLSIGAAAVVTGGVLVFMNRGKTVYETPAPAQTTVRVVPTVGGGAVTWSGTF